MRRTIVQRGVCVVVLFSACAWAAERKDVRVLFDFEDAAELDVLRKSSENLTFDIVQDNCVTSGRNCGRVVGKQGAEYSIIELRGEQAKGWDKYEYFALDAFLDRPQSLRVAVELWDRASTNYATRCTYEECKLHPGRSTLLLRIDRSKRNSKEGREWEELEAKDKIDRANLKTVKLFFTPFKDGGDTVIWIDKVRLMQEDAVGGKLQVALPPGAKAWDFGPKALTTPGLEWVGVESGGRSAKNCVGEIVEVGKVWPDTLTGNGITGAAGEFTFNAQVPNGEYCVWLSAGKLLDPERRAQPYLLKVGETVLCDEKLSERDYYGEKGVFRHLRTQYSQRPNALWLDYVEPEAQEFVLKATVTDGVLPVKVSNHRLSALILVPAKEEAAFKTMCAAIREQRVKTFMNTVYVEAKPAPKAAAGDGAYSLWVPKSGAAIRPWSVPGDAERKLQASAAQGQRLTFCVAVTPSQDLGIGDIEISDLKGPGTIPSSAFRRYYQNYRVHDTSVDEMALLPWTKIRFEPGITWAYWLWLKVPDDAAPGAYTGTVTFKAEQGGPKTLPVALEVYPFKLAAQLPVSYAMYYSLWDFTPAQPPDGMKPLDFRIKLMKEQFQFMHEVGLTAAYLPAPGVMEGSLRPDGVQPFWAAVKETPLAKHPAQNMMAPTLGLARRTANEMFFKQDASKGRNYTDRNPGAEIALPGFREKYLAVIAQYKKWVDAMGLPVAVEVVDEPREMPNPWNRRRDETIAYGDWLKEAGFTTFVTFMGDSNSGKDYTPIAEHVDIVSVHAWEASAKLIAKARELKKTLWIYNTGMDRYSWGFYNWRMNSTGRSEWHFCFVETGAAEGFPNPHEWYTPFTNLNGYTVHAPYYDFPGGMLFKSVYFGVAEGITDYAYVYTLEQAIAAAKGDAAKAKIADEAAAFLAAVRKAIPEFAKIKNMASPDAGALVGQGLDTPAAEMCEPWRRKIAEYLIRLKK